MGCGVRQRGCGALQRAPGYDGRVHAVAGQPGWSAGGDEFQRYGSGGGWLLLPGRGRGRGRECGSVLERGGGDGRGHAVAPSAPGTVSAVGSVGQATLSWAAASDNVGVLRYNVHRSTTAGFTPSAANRIAQPATPGYIDTTAPGSYFYKVTAEDAAGNIGPVSNEAAATVTADTTAPSAPSALTAPVTGATANLAWTGSTDNVAVLRYNVHRGSSAGFSPSAGNRIAQPTGTSHADSGLATGTYYYKVTAEDAAGNISAASNEATATVADATPPSAPGTLTATATASTINLGWGAATDNVAVSRYNLHRGTSSGFTPSSGNRIAQPTGLSHADTGLAPGTYFYKLTAEDAAGNIGPLSNTATATVTDTTPPSSPTLSANGGAGQTSLSWTAATDNVAVTRYNLHRSTTSGFTPSTANRIAQPTTTSYTDTGLTAGTYYYKLTAEDAAGNTQHRQQPSHQHRHHPTRHRPRRRLRPRHRHRHHHHRPIRHRQQRHPQQHHLGRQRQRQIRQRPHLQRHQRHRHHPRHHQPRPHHRHDPRSLGPTHQPRQHLPHGHDEGADGEHDVRALRQRLRKRPGADRRDLCRRLPRCARHGAVAIEHLDASRRHLQRQCPGVVRQRRPGRAALDRRLAHRDDESAADRRQRDLGRVLPGRHRRNPHLQPRPPRHRNPNRHEHLDHESGWCVAVGAGCVGWVGWVEFGVVVVGCGVRQRGCGALQRAPGYDGRVHAVAGQPGWSAGGDEFQRYGSGGGWLLLPGRCRGRGRECGSVLERGGGDGRGHAVAPSAPGTVSAVGSVGKATLSWAAASDNVGVLRYNVHRSTTAGFTPSAANRIAQPATPGYIDTTAPGSYFYKVTAEDAAGNIGPVSNEAAATVTADTTAPSVPSALTAPVTGATANLAWTGSTDDVAVLRYNVHRGSSAGFSPSAGNRIAQPTGTSHADGGLATGTYYYKVTAEDAAGNISAASNEATATVADATPPSAPGTLTATATASTINLGWGAATDNVAVSRYNLHRGTSSGFTPSSRQPDRATDRAQPRRQRPRPRHLLLQAHRRRRRRQHRPAQQHRHRHRHRHHPTQQPHPHRQRRRRPNQPQLDRRHRQRRRHPLQPPPLHHKRLHPQHRQPDRPTHHHQLHRHRPHRRHLLLQAHRRRRRRQHSAPPATKPPAPSPPHPSPASSPPTASTPAPAPPSPTNPAPATTAPSATPPGPATATANTATPSPSTAPTPPPPSPTPPASTSPPA